MKNYNNHRNELTLFNYGTYAVSGSPEVLHYSGTSQAGSPGALNSSVSSNSNYEVQASGTATGSQDTRESHFEGGFLIRKGLKFKFLNFTPIVLERKEEAGHKGKPKLFLRDIEAGVYISSLYYQGSITKGNLRGEVWTFDFPPGKKAVGYALIYWENRTSETLNIGRPIRKEKKLNLAKLKI
jgi:stage V sporulation protein SpoVS